MTLPSHLLCEAEAERRVQRETILRIASRLAVAYMANPTLHDGVHLNEFGTHFTGLATRLYAASYDAVPSPTPVVPPPMVADEPERVGEWLVESPNLWQCACRRPLIEVNWETVEFCVHCGTVRPALPGARGAS